MYMQREPIGSIGDNRIWSVLTIENAIGAATGGGVMYSVAQALGIAGDGFGPGFWVQAVMIVAGLALGAGATVRVRGLSLVDRISLFVTFQIQQMSGQNRVDPPIEASIWALSTESDDLLPLLDDDMLAALEAEHGGA
jgi:hypothetical protein